MRPLHHVGSWTHESWATAMKNHCKTFIQHDFISYQQMIESRSSRNFESLTRRETQEVRWSTPLWRIPSLNHLAIPKCKDTNAYIPHRIHPAPMAAKTLIKEAKVSWTSSQCIELFIFSTRSSLCSDAGPKLDLNSQLNYMFFSPWASPGRRWNRTLAGS